MRDNGVVQVKKQEIYEGYVCVLHSEMLQIELQYKPAS